MALFRHKGQATSAPGVVGSGSRTVQAMLVLSRAPLTNRDAVLQHMLDRLKAEGHTFDRNFKGQVDVGDPDDLPYVYTRIRMAFEEFGGHDLADRTKQFPFRTTDGAVGKYFVVFEQLPDGSPGATKSRASDTLLRESFGDELSDRLIDLLGAEDAADFAQTWVAEIRKRWATRNEPGFMTEEQKLEMHDASHGAPGADTIQGRARFFVDYMAERLAEQVAAESIEKAGLPNDRALFLDIGAGLLLTLQGL